MVVEPSVNDVWDISLRDGDPGLDADELGGCKEVVHCSDEGCGVIENLEESRTAGTGLGYLGGGVGGLMTDDSKAAEGLKG